MINVVASSTNIDLKSITSIARTPATNLGRRPDLPRMSSQVFQSNSSQLKVLVGKIYVGAVLMLAVTVVNLMVLYRYWSGSFLITRSVRRYIKTEASAFANDEQMVGWRTLSGGECESLHGDENFTH